MDFEFKHVPTLVIGLGGSGNEVARLLKARFSERYPGQATLIRYLIVDTDRKSFRDGFWDREEQVFLKLSLMPRHVLAAFYNNEHVDWLPQEPRVSPDHFVNQESGAGLIRPIGRLYLQDQIIQVRDRLEKAKNSLSDLVERKKTGTILGTGDFQIYIISSLAGGTGSGAFLDMAALVRETFEENSFITGMFTLFSCYAEVLRGDVDQARRSKANCYAALKELEFFMQDRDDKLSQLYNLKFWDGTRINLYKRLFNTCYLVENANDGGAQLSGLRQVYELCAQQLFHEIASPLGEDYRSKINNLCFFQTGLSGEEWRDWGRKRRFSSFGSVSVGLPVQKILNYGVNQLSARLVGLMLGDEPESPSSGASQTPEVVELGNWQNWPELLGELTDRFSEHTFPFRLTEGIGDMNSLVNRCREEAEQGISQLGKVIDLTCNELFAGWVMDIEAKVLNHKLGQGLVRAQKFAVTCAEVLDRVVGEAGQDLERCRQDVMFQTGEINRVLGKLAGLGVVGRLLAGKTKQNALVDLYHTWLNCRLEKEVSSILGEKLHKLVAIMEGIRRDLAQAKVELSRIEQNCIQNLQKISFQAGRNADSTVLVQEAVTKEECDAWVQKHYPTDLWEVSHRIWLEPTGSLGDRVTRISEAYFTQVLEKTTLIKFLREKFAGKEEWNQFLDELREVCRPFWTARLKHGEHYNQTCLIGLAVDGNDFPKEVEDWARDRSDATRGIDIVNTHFSYAMDITVCTHGAFAGYLSGVPDYYFHYEQFLRNREFPLHLHEQFRTLPELDPNRGKVGHSSHG